MSADAAIEFMRAYLLRKSAIGDETLIRVFVNRRKGDPSKIELFRSHVEYPEPGVIRYYCDSSNMHMWYDKVISKSKFRTRKGT